MRVTPVITLSSDSDTEMPEPVETRKSSSGELDTENAGDEITIIEVVQLPTSEPSHIEPKPSNISEEHDELNDPFFLYRWNDIQVGTNDNPTPTASEHVNLYENLNNGVNQPLPNNNNDVERASSPQPSTSTSSVCNKRTAGTTGGHKNKEGRSPAKRVRFASGENLQSNNTSTDSDPDDITPSRRRKPLRISSGSEADDSSDDMFIPVVVLKKRLRKRVVPATSASSKNSDHTQEKYRSKGKPKLIKKKQVIDTSESSSESASNASGKEGSEHNASGQEGSEHNASGQEGSESNASGQEGSESKSSNEESESPKGSVRRSKRALRNRKNLKKAEALEQLRQRRERLASKPKPATSDDMAKASKHCQNEDSETDDSDTSAPSPCPIVDNSTTEGSDFDGSTPSSSSVTSSGETDEEPDLEIGGSDGEKDLEKEENESDGGDNNVDKSCSSSSEEEGTLGDGEDDPRCILCKNLGSANIEGRAEEKDVLSWCKCGECKVFATEVNDYDLVCCQEIKHVVGFLDDELEDADVCVTKHSRFNEDVLKNGAYARSISKHQEPKRFGSNSTANFWENYSCGKADYRAAERAKQEFINSGSFDKMTQSIVSYLHWVFDQLGDEADQMVIPACVQHKVRKNFKIPRDYFFPFQPNRKCSIGRHCRLAGAD